MKTGEPQRADEAIDHTPPTASCMSPTSEHGRLLKGCEGEWTVGLGRPIRNSEALERSRMGHSSLSVGKPRTPGRALTAKAPSLGKYGVQRYVANRVPSERASCSLVVLRGHVGEMGSSTDERL